MDIKQALETLVEAGYLTREEVKEKEDAAEKSKTRKFLRNEAKAALTRYVKNVTGFNDSENLAEAALQAIEDVSTMGTKETKKEKSMRKPASKKSDDEVMRDFFKAIGVDY